MPQRPRARQKLKQRTLLGFLDSSPPSSPPARQFPRYPSPGPSKRKRETSSSSSSSASSSSSRSDKAENTDSDVGAIQFEPEVVEISDGDYSPRRPKRHKSLLVGAHAIPNRTTSDESPEERLKVPRNRKGKNRVVLDSDDEDEAQLHKRKLVKGIRPPTPEDDDDDIIKAENQVLESRLRSRGKVTAFQKNLEKLKILKGKKRGEIVLGSSSSGDERSESPTSAPFEGAKPHHSSESDASDDDEEEVHDFIVDDEALSVPPAQLPLAFSLSTHQDLAHHFKVVCQLFVHVAVRPLVDRRPFLERALKEEEYLSVPLQVTRRKLSGMRDSLVSSSVWRSSFKKALETYPRFTRVRLKFTVSQCDACQLGGRVSTLLGRLSGEPYDEYDFESVSDEEPNEDSEENSDTGNGREVKEMFYLGRYCAARTQVYHQFSHWEYSLYKSLQREIMAAQDGARVAYFGRIKPPRDLHDADRVMEWLDERGIIDAEWRKVRHMMDSARNLERGEVDDDGIA